MKTLFCVLNWGLGHASRSSVLIQRLIQEGHDVTIASDGVALTHLKKRFPDQSFLELPAYNIRYASRSMIINMAFQARKSFERSKRNNVLSRPFVRNIKLNRLFLTIAMDVIVMTYHRIF